MPNDKEKQIVPPEGYLEQPKVRYHHVQRLEKELSDLQARVAFIEEVLSAFPPVRTLGPPPPAPVEPGGLPGMPGTAHPGGTGPGGGVIALGFWYGPILHAPSSQLAAVCQWSSVTVILSRRGVFGGVTPMAGQTITFTITAGTGVSIAANNGGPGVRPGAGVNVTTNAMGEATIWFHGTAAGTVTLEADGPGLSKDTTINIV